MVCHFASKEGRRVLVLCGLLCHLLQIWLEWKLEVEWGRGLDAFCQCTASLAHVVCACKHVLIDSYY